MFKAFALATASAALLAGCNSMDGMMASRNLTSVVENAPTPSSNASYVARAAAANQFELQASQIALQKAQDAKVREFAQMVVNSHARTAETLATQVRKAGVAMPSMTLSASHAGMISELQSASGAAFDRLYVQHLSTTHAEALALHQAYSLGGDNFDLRYAAGAAVPTIQSHLRQLQELSTAVG